MDASGSENVCTLCGNRVSPDEQHHDLRKLTEVDRRDVAKGFGFTTIQRTMTCDECGQGWIIREDHGRFSGDFSMRRA